jgi:hypothetical protein
MTYEKLWMNDDLYMLLKWQWDHRHPASLFVFCHMNPKSKLYGKPHVARWKMLKKLCKEAKVEAFEYHDIRHTLAKYLNDIHKVGLKKVSRFFAIGDRRPLKFMSKGIIPTPKMRSVCSNNPT